MPSPQSGLSSANGATNAAPLQQELLKEQQKTSV
jgi:hypothetical protein